MTHQLCLLSLPKLLDVPLELTSPMHLVPSFLLKSRFKSKVQTTNTTLKTLIASQELDPMVLEP
jgi:hypothetical protein